MKRILPILALSFALPWSAQASTHLNAQQLDALIYITRSVGNCPIYSINYGRNKPYSEGCVDNLSSSTAKLLKAFVPEHPSLAKDIMRVQDCSYYVLNYGRNKPYDASCVDRLVETVVDRLKDLKESVTTPPSG